MSPDDPTKRVTVIAKAGDATREEMIKALTRHYAETLGYALLAPIPDADLADYTPQPKNRAQRRKETRRGR